MLGGVVRWMFALFVLLQFVVRIPLVACELRIIDDLHGDLSNPSNQVQYPGHNWNPSNSGEGCPFCYGHQLDYSQVVQGSWHYNVDGTNMMNISFVGTTISVYYILPQFGLPISTSFILDGVPQHEAFIHNPTNDSNNPFIYNATAFHADGLENLQHHLIISINPLSSILFDYATYNYVDPDGPLSSTASSPSPSDSSLVSSSTSAMPSASGTPTPDNVFTTSHAAESIDTSTPSPGPTSTFSPANAFTASPSAGPLSMTPPQSGTSSTAPSPSGIRSLASLSGSAAPASSSPGGTVALPSSSATAISSPSGSSRTSQVGMIAGAASGGCVVIMIALLLFCIWFRRRRRAGHKALRKADASAFVHKNESATASNDNILESWEAITSASTRDQMNPKQMAAERRTFFARDRDTHAHTASSAGSDVPLVGTRINPLQAETDRLRAQYAAGPPPTYVSEPGLDQTSTEIV